MHDVELLDHQDFPGSSRNPNWKTVLKRTKNTPVAPVRGTVSREPKLGFPRIRNLAKEAARAFRWYQERQNPTSGVRSNTRANTDKKQGKMGRRFDAFFFRTAAFARRVFPTRCKLTRKPGCVGKIMTPATTCNSRFADSIPHSTGIFTGKTHKNSSGTPTSGSHNSLVRTPIRVNFIPLESRRRDISNDMLHDPF